MFEGLKARRAKQNLEIRRTQMAMKQLDLVEIMIGNSAKHKESLKDRDEDSWSALSGYNYRKLDEADADELRESVVKSYYKNGHAKNAIRLIEKYVVGRGFDIVPKSTLPKVREFWETYWRVNRMELKKKEVVRRTMRDGEIFIRYFKADLDGMLLNRFMNPEFVKPPTEDQKIKGNASCGIETSDDDVEEVLAYWYKEKRILAEEIQHHKIMVDSDVKRGRSYIESVIADLAMYRDWMRDRIKLNKVRAAVALVRKVTGTPAQARNIADQYDTTARKSPDNEPYMRAPEGVSVYTTSKGVEYDMMAPNLQASDVQHDGRAILLAIAAGTGLAEYALTGDASNANFASTMVAEAPMVREFMDWQDYFGIVFKDMFAKVIESGIQAHAIPSRELVQIPNPEDPEIMDEELEETSTECEVIFPEIIHRKLKEETEAYTLQRSEGILSRRTMAGRLDLDYEAEKEKIVEEDREETEIEPAPEEKSDEEFIKARDAVVKPPAKEKEPKT